MKMIVGLGNPGKEYVNTKHNMGFRFLDNFANKHNIEITKEKFGGLYALTKRNNDNILLLKPQKYINLSGEVIKKFIDYYKINLNDVLIIHDDLDLPIGKYRLRAKGTSGGHNGLKNIELNLSTQEYQRLKLGIANGNNVFDMKDYVLSTFTTNEEEIISELYDKINDIIEDFLELDFEKLMSKYN